MKNFVGVNLAVPSKAILKFDDPNKLAFETSSWMHLKQYISKVEKLPTKFNEDLTDTNKALVRLRAEVEKFGSPKELRKLLTEKPNVLAEDNSPSMYYAAIVWLVQQLHDSTTSTIITLQSVLRSAGSSNDIKEGLIFLGNKADTARNPIRPLIVSLKSFKDKIIEINNSLSKACKADTEILHRKQERVGALQVKIEDVQKKIDELGFFSSKQKRTELEQELRAVQQELGSTEAQSEKLRSAVSEFESILEDGAWLKSSLNELVEFFDNIRKVWTDFGTSLTQMAADATDEQLENLTFVKQALGFDEAIKQWTAIDQAAKEFTVNSLIDNYIDITLLEKSLNHEVFSRPKSSFTKK